MAMLIKEIAYTMAASLTLAVSLAVAPALSEDKAPMPQTRGMQGMDPALHDRDAEVLYVGCVPNPDKAAQQAKHPMPQTRGMQGMDPKAHTMDCPKGYVPRQQPAHVHKGPGN
jgi:hypothetical protein